MYEEAPGFFVDEYWKRWMDLVHDRRFSWEVVTAVKSARAPALGSEGPVVEVYFPAGTKPLALFTASGFGVAPRK